MIQKLLSETGTIRESSEASALTIAENWRRSSERRRAAQVASSLRVPRGEICSHGPHRLTFQAKMALPLKDGPAIEKVVRRPMEGRDEDENLL